MNNRSPDAGEGGAARTSAMIRVLLADDEPHAIRRLKRLIEQANPEFQVTAAARDGEEALELISRQKFDCVFTDIRMPMLDGVGLMERIREKWPRMNVVVVSSYSDFEYMSGAMRAQALDYLLKPVTLEALTPLLQKLSDRLSEERRRFMNGLLANRLNKAASQAGEDFRADQAREERLGALLLCAGPVAVCESPELCPGVDFWHENGVGAKVERALYPDADAVWSYVGDTPSERIVLYPAGSAAPEAAARRVFAAVTEAAGMPVSCVYAARPIQMPELTRAYRALRQCLEKQTRIGQSLILGADPLSAPEAPRAPAPARKGALSLARAALTDREGEAEAADALFRQLTLENWPQAEVHRLLRDAVNQLAENHELDAQAARQMQLELMDAVSSALSMDELKQEVRSIARSGAPAGTRQEAGEKKGVAAAIATYLKENYREHITNQTLAARFGYVPSYLSAIFRRAYHASPAEYLMDVRVEAAKRLMLEKPDILMRDVAARVGFKSQYHFSRVFKQHEGVQPTAFRGVTPP